MKTALRTILWIALLVVMVLTLSSPTLVAGAEGAQAFESLPWDGAAPYKPSKDGYNEAGDGYEDASIRVSIETDRAYETDIMICLVDIVDPTQLRTARAGRYGSKAVAPVTEIATLNNAVVACNGDYFSYHDSGLVVRNGVALRNRPDPDRDILIIDDKGDFTLLQSPTSETVDAFEGTMIQAFSFGPALIINGEKRTDQESIAKDMAPLKTTQRIAICQRGPLSYAIVATEGPENENGRGLTLPEFIDYLYGLGYEQAYNLDGGSSSTIAMRRKKLNALSSRKTRSVGDIIYFATLINSGE